MFYFIKLTTRTILAFPLIMKSLSLINFLMKTKNKIISETFSYIFIKQESKCLTDFYPTKNY